MSNNTLLRRIYQLLTIPIQEKWVGTLQAGAVVRSLYLTWVLREFISTNASYNILDAGSGRGAPLTLVQARRFKNCHFVAVDLNQDYPARQHFGIPENVRFVKSDITNYTTNVLFDIVICLDVLEHIENYEQVIIRFSKCLRPSGKLILLAPKSLIRRDPQNFPLGVDMPECFLIAPAFTLLMLMSVRIRIPHTAVICIPDSRTAAIS